MAVAGSDTQAEDRGDVDDAAATPGLGQPLRGDLGDAPDAVQVGRQHGAPIFLADLQRALAVTDAGIVEHHIDHPEMRLGSIEGRLDAGAVGDVEGDRQRLGTLPLDILGDLLEPLDAPRSQYHAGSGASGQPRQVRAYTAGGAGDQHGSVGEGEVLGKIVTHRYTSNSVAARLVCVVGSLSLRERARMRGCVVAPMASPAPGARGKYQILSMRVLPAATRRSSSGAGWNHISPYSPRTWR
ncbi:hypothetical protein D9M70_505510 [compost metagenome]